MNRNGNKNWAGRENLGRTVTEKEQGLEGWGGFKYKERDRNMNFLKGEIGTNENGTGMFMDKEGFLREQGLGEQVLDTR